MDWSIRASILWSQGESLSRYIYNDCSPIQEGLLFRVFMAVSLRRCDWLNHPPHAWAQSPAPLSSLEAKGGGWKCQPCIHLVGFPDKQPSPHSETTQGPALSHLISINSGVVERGSFHFYQSPPNITTKEARGFFHLGDYKGFRSSGQEPGAKTKIHISYYITISQQCWAESSKMPISGDIYFLCDMGCTVIQ